MKISQIETVSETACAIHFEESDGTPQGQVLSDFDKLALTLLELLTTYEIESVSIRDMMTESQFLRIKAISDLLPQVQYHFDRLERKVIAELKDGDTGAILTGEGSTVLRAIGDLLHAQGFKTVLLDDGELTVEQFILDVCYGRKRISDELLQAEMEEIMVPEKGGW